MLDMNSLQGLMLIHPKQMLDFVTDSL